MILGINTDGKKEVLTIQVGDNESSKYWLAVLNELKKPRCKRHPDPLCRWSDWNQGSYCSCLSENRVSALYRTSGTEYAEICSG